MKHTKAMLTPSILDKGGWWFCSHKVGNTAEDSLKDNLGAPGFHKFGQHLLPLLALSAVELACRLSLSGWGVEKAPSGPSRF